MRTWIFQANPKKFDVDTFLTEQHKPFSWLVTRYAREISIGDVVYIWRASGGESDKAGVVAEAKVISEIEHRPAELESERYWTDSRQASAKADRVWLQLIRRGSAKELLRRDWLEKDPALMRLLILRQPNGTNFPVSYDEAERLAKMWARVGQNWSRNESLAGLWAYVATLGREVSQKPGTPVEQVSQLTGRALPGVYNKVMNFRAIDPRDERQGMSGAAQIDRDVWREFYDDETNDLDHMAINAEFGRIWLGLSSSSGTPLDITALKVGVEREVEKLKGKPLLELLAAFASQDQGGRVRKPSVRAGTSMVFERNPLVVAIARVRAGERCEVPDCPHPSFLMKDGTPYIEVHHLVPLSEGGEDRPENVACVCAAHHREAHWGLAARNIFQQLAALRTRD